jgi:hypothetical protein
MTNFSDADATSLPLAAIATVEPKWWGHSLTIWGAVVTGLAAILPAIGPAVGVEISGDVVRSTGDQAASAAQAVIGLAGTLLAIFGRVRATRPLAQREVTVKL